MEELCRNNLAGDSSEKAQSGKPIMINTEIYAASHEQLPTVINHNPLSVRGHVSTAPFSVSKVSSNRFGHIFIKIIGHSLHKQKEICFSVVAMLKYYYWTQPGHTHTHTHQPRANFTVLWELKQLTQELR